MSSRTPPRSNNPRTSHPSRGGGGRTHHSAGRAPNPGRTNRDRATNAPVQLHEASRIPHGHVPAYLPGSASLVEELDKRVMIVLRDGRHLVGRLCSYDQYSNLVLEGAYERQLCVDSETGTASYHDIPLGIYVVRGDTVVLMGRVVEDEQQHRMKPVSQDELNRLKAASKEPLEWDFDTDLIA